MNGTPPLHVLIIERDAAFTARLGDMLRGQQAADVTIRRDASSTLPTADLICLDPTSIAPGIDAVDFVRRASRDAGVIVIAKHLSVESAVAFMRAGAVDCLTTPIDFGRLSAAVRGVAATRRIQSDPTASTSHAAELVTQRVATSNSTILITGETGTGKSRLARQIHDRSPRRDQPFVTLACGSLVPALAGSELFGHVRGAFSDATADSVGRLAAAEHGTLLLDDVDAASPELQLLLLRLLQERTFEPVGSNDTRQADVRFVATTNADLSALVRTGRFREDLFHRLNVIAIDLPTLRDRPAEILPLADDLLAAHAWDPAAPAKRLTPATRDALRAYHWPGNVRELEHAMQRASLMSPTTQIDCDALPPAIRGLSNALPAASLQRARDTADRATILAALDRHGWNRQQTAADLGIERTTLYKRMRSLGIPLPKRAA